MFKPTLYLILLLFITACQPGNWSPVAHTATPTGSSTPAEIFNTPYVYMTPTPGYPEEGFGPFGLPLDINPLTGLSTDPKLLDRRPMIIKVSNLPRNVRPQSGLSKADIVYEYYTEEGTTRFSAIFLSQEAGQVGSVRSARFFDEHLVKMYNAWFVFGSADERIIK